MNIIDLVKTRRNIKQFKSDPVDHERLISWLQAAAYAPNHRLNEPWEILFIGQEIRAKLNHKTNFGGAPVLLAILSQPGKTSFHRDENIMAVSCFIQNFLLCAHDSGLGTGWSSLGATVHNRAVLNVPEGYDVVGLIPIGYPEEMPDPKERTEITNKINYLP